MGDPQGKISFPVKILNYFLCHSNDPDAPRKSCGRKCIDCLKPDMGQPEHVSPEQEPAREKWGNRCQFFVTTLGMSVGLGSVWRFPTLTYKNGGAAFLIMYTFMIMTMGNALFFFEVSNGQYTSKNPLKVYDKVPLFQGVGTAMLFYSYLFCTYYNHLVSFSFFYLFTSLQWPLPWTYCPNEENDFPDSVVCVPYHRTLDPDQKGIVCGDNSFVFNRTEFCRDEAAKESVMKKCCSGLEGDVSGPKCKDYVLPDRICSEQEYPSAFYWSHTVMKKYRPGDPKYGYLGELNFPLVGTSFLAWFICYVGLYKGLKSLGIMMYIIVPLPYVILIIMFIAGVIQEGALNGIKELFVPDMYSFINIDIWRSAIEQAFYSIGTAMGPLITFGSYQKFNAPSHLDGTLICACIVLTGLLCSLVVFCALGFLAYRTGKPFDEVVEAGPGLIFIVYPESIELLPGSIFFSILFYLMLINLGVSSVTSIIETVSSACYDIWPSTRNYKYIVNLVVLFSCFIIGLSICSRGGLAVYNAFDTYAAGMTLIPLCALELAIIVFIYGLGRFCEDIAFMIGFYPISYYRYQWLFGPFFLMIIFCYGLVKFEPPTEWKLWTHILSWFLFLLIMGNIPAVMIAQVIIYMRRKELKNILKPPPSHGPSNPSDKIAREGYSVRRRIFGWP